MINPTKIICPQCASVVDTDQVRELLDKLAEYRKDWAYLSGRCATQQAQLEEANHKYANLIFSTLDGPEPPPTAQD